MWIDWFANTTMVENAQWNTGEKQEHSMFACGCELAIAQTPAFQCVHKYAMSAHQFSAFMPQTLLPDSLLGSAFQPEPRHPPVCLAWLAGTNDTMLGWPRP
jgi:hypothetical protein